MNYYLVLIVSLFLYMSFWFLVSLKKKRNDVADTAWGLGFVLMAWLSFIISDSSDLIGLLVNCLVSTWGLRLAWHIHSRNKNKPEDYRYQIWREEWGKWFYIRSYFQVFILQGFFLLLISLPVFIINNSVDSDIGLVAVLGLLVWLVGFYFESVGDAQLKRFIKNPKNKGKIMQEGLWSYSRHPNYFGEVTQWWGIWIIALTVPYGWLGIVGPLTISTLILYVSGVPMLENKMAENPEFKEYKNRVSKFFPLPQKN